MLENFIAANRAAIIDGARARAEARTSFDTGRSDHDHGVPVFLDQLETALRLTRSSAVIDHERISQTAGIHGAELLRRGYTIGQVVHGYGDVCQTIAELIATEGAVMSPQEFRTLNLCLDDAIAEAVTVYARQRERAITAEGTERLGALAHELRNHLSTALISFESIKTGRVAVGGSTGLVHGRSLLALSRLIDRSLADVRLDAGIERLETINVAELVGEVEIAAVIQAVARGLHFGVSSVDAGVMIQGDRDILAAAISNLLQNAFKLTRPDGHVTLTVRATSERVLFEVEDECGGLPPGKAEELFRPYVQRGTDRSGLGLGLSICLKAARANGGELRVRDLPGRGCIFTLDLPRKPPPPLMLVEGGLGQSVAIRDSGIDARAR